MTTATTHVPDRTLDQRMTALEIANDIRSFRSRLKKDIAAGRASFLTALAAPSEQLQSIKLLELLLSVPGIGRVKAHQILKATGTSASKTLGGLSDRQRREVASETRRRMRPSARARETQP